MDRDDQRICSNCQYPLSGLPRQGKCPECGGGFNTASGLGITYPQSGQDKANQIARRLKTIFLTALLVSSLSCMGVVAAFRTFLQPSKNFWWFVGCLSAFFLLMLIGNLLDQYKKDA